MLEQILQREVVIAFAVIGAAGVMLGTWLMRRMVGSQIAQAVYWGGYGATGTSVLLFILAGLLGVGP
jgi:hypothetical protein